jgi:hypothetical protein
LSFGESKEVIGGFLNDDLLAPAGVRLELDKILTEVLIDLEDSALVVASVTVVGGAEDCHH